VGEVKEGVGRRKEGVGKKACGGKGEYAPLALGRMDAPVQKHRLIERKIIFIVPPCTPGSQKWGTMSMSPHTSVILVMELILVIVLVSFRTNNLYII